MGPQLIQRLSETRPIRAAARATAYVYLRGKQGSMKGLCFVEKSHYAFKGLDDIFHYTLLHRVGLKISWDLRLFTSVCLLLKLRSRNF